MKKHHKLTALVIAAVMFISVTPVSVFADEESVTEEILTETETTRIIEESEIEETVAETEIPVTEETEAEIVLEDDNTQMSGVGEQKTSDALQMDTDEEAVENVLLNADDTDADSSVLDTGTLDNGITWVLDEIGVLVISGTGELPDYSDDSPWNNHADINKIVIENGITNIGDNSFYSCSNLTCITIPDSVVRIGEDAFALCEGLTEINYIGSMDDWTAIEGSGFYLETSAVVHASDGTISPDLKVEISECKISALSAKVYTGKAQTQAIEIFNGETQLKESEDFTVGYKNNINAGTATVVITGAGDYTGTVEKTFKITPKSVTPSVTLTRTAITYTGNNLRPAATVKAGSTVLKKDTDYTITYPSACKNVGSYNVIVKLKGNYSGSKTVSYKINPKGTRIYNVVGSKDQFVVKWSKQTTEVTGYQIQYSVTSDFSSGNKAVYVTPNTTYYKTIKKPVSGKNYFVRIRTYKIVNGTKYFSPWSSAVSSIVKKSLVTKKSITLRSTNNWDYTKGTEQYSVKFKITNRMYAMLPVSLTISETDITRGGIWITLKDSSGKIWQNDAINLKNYEYDDTYENWFINDGGLLPPGEYTYTIKNSSDGDVKVNIGPIQGFSKIAASVSISKNVSVRSGNWIKIGKFSDGLPVFSDLSSTNAGVVSEWEMETDGTLYVWAEKKGKATLTVKLKNGKTFTTVVNVTAGDPDFDAYLCDYNTRDNYFEVKIRNNRSSNLIIIRTGKVEDVDYKTFDRTIKTGSNITIKPGQTKYVRFYLKGSTTWPDYEDYTLCAKFQYEGITYLWHVWDEDSVYEDTGGWYPTYWGDFDWF